MKVSHDEETDAGDDEADEFDLFIRGGARGEVIRNLLIKSRDAGAGD